MDSWTFCSDELPDKNDDYLVIWKLEGYKRAFYEIQEFYVEEGWIVNIPQAGEKAVEIIAWQELPAIPEGV